MVGEVQILYTEKYHFYSHFDGQCAVCVGPSLFSSQANRIIEHRRKYERKREEREIKEKQERIKKAKEEHARAQKVSYLVKKLNNLRGGDVLIPSKVVIKCLSRPYRKRKLEEGQGEEEEEEQDSSQVGMKNVAFFETI